MSEYNLFWKEEQNIWHIILEFYFETTELINSVLSM